jgi:hypothetical protein
VIVLGIMRNFANETRYGKKKRNKKQYGRVLNLSDRRKGTRGRGVL